MKRGAGKKKGGGREREREGKQGQLSSTQSRENEETMQTAIKMCLH